MLGHNVAAHHHLEHCHFNDLNTHISHTHSHNQSHDHSDHHPEAHSFFHILSHLHHGADGFSCIGHQSLLSENLRQINLYLPVISSFSDINSEVIPLLIQHSHFFDSFICDPRLTLNIGLRAPPLFIH